jgi:hypothetical protein
LVAVGDNVVLLAATHIDGYTWRTGSNGGPRAQTPDSVLQRRIVTASGLLASVLQQVTGWSPGPCHSRCAGPLDVTSSRLCHQLLAASKDRDGGRVVLGKVKGGGDALGADHTLVTRTHLSEAKKAAGRTQSSTEGLLTHMLLYIKHGCCLTG